MLQNHLTGIIRNRLPAEQTRFHILLAGDWFCAVFCCAYLVHNKFRVSEEREDDISPALSNLVSADRAIRNSSSVKVLLDRIFRSRASRLLRTRVFSFDCFIIRAFYSKILFYIPDRFTKRQAPCFFPEVDKITGLSCIKIGPDTVLATPDVYTKGPALLAEYIPATVLIAFESSPRQEMFYDSQSIRGKP